MVKQLIRNLWNDRSSKNTLSFFLFTSKLIRFWILHSNWVRLNLFISCFITVCLYGKVTHYCFTDVLVAVTMNIHDKVSFNKECFKNFLPSSSIQFTISGVQ